MTVSDGPAPPVTTSGLQYDYARCRFFGMIAGVDVDEPWRVELMPAILEGVTGMCNRNQAEALLRLAQNADPRGTLVEVGSLEGYTSIHVGWGSKSGPGRPVYCVDPHEGDLGVRRVVPTWDKFLRNVARAGVADIIRPIRQSSAAAAASFEHPVSLCYIDALHDYENVRLDLESWAVHFLDGAIVAFDDAVADFPGVQRLEWELRCNVDRFSYEGRLGAGFYGRWHR